MSDPAQPKTSSHSSETSSTSAVGQIAFMQDTLPALLPQTDRTGDDVETVEAPAEENDVEAAASSTGIGGAPEDAKAASLDGVRKVQSAFGLKRLKGVTFEFILGILAGICSAVIGGLLSGLTHYVGGSIPATEITFVRAIFGLVILFPLVGRHVKRLATASSLAVWLRSAAAAVSGLCFTWNLEHTSAGMANIIFEFSLIFIIGFEIFFEKVHFGLTQTLAFIVLIAGTVIYFKAGISPISVSIVSVGLIGSFFAAVSYIALKKASLEADPWMIYWTLCLVSVPLAFVINTGEWVLPSMSSSLALTVIAFGTLVGQYLLVVSFEKLPLAVAAALVPSCIVWSVVWDGVIDGDINLSAGLGSLVYTLGVCGLLIERKKDHKRLHGHHVTSR